jgi:hypothetical protein
MQSIRLALKNEYQNFQPTPSLVLSVLTACAFAVKLGVFVVRLYRGIRSVQSILEAGLCSILFIVSILLLIFSLRSDENILGVFRP